MLFSSCYYVLLPFTTFKYVLILFTTSTQYQYKVQCSRFKVQEGSRRSKKVTTFCYLFTMFYYIVTTCYDYLLHCYYMLLLFVCFNYFYYVVNSVYLVLLVFTTFSQSIIVRRFKKVQEGSRRFKEVQGGSRWFKKVVRRQ